MIASNWSGEATSALIEAELRNAARSIAPLNEKSLEDILLNVIIVSRDTDRRRYDLVMSENSKLLCIILVGAVAS